MGLLGFFCSPCPPLFSLKLPLIWKKQAWYSSSLIHEATLNLSGRAYPEITATTPKRAKSKRLPSLSILLETVVLAWKETQLLNATGELMQGWGGLINPFSQNSDAPVVQLPSS